MGIASQLLAGSIQGAQAEGKVTKYSLQQQTKRLPETHLRGASLGGQRGGLLGRDMRHMQVPQSLGRLRSLPKRRYHCLTRAVLYCGWEVLPQDD